MDYNSNTKTTAAVCPHCGARLTVDNRHDSAVCDYCGMPFPVEKPIERLREAQPVYAAAQAAAAQPPEKKHTLLWVLGWIFIFPVPLTILMLRNRSLPTWARYGIIAAGWIVYLLIAFSRPKSDGTQPAEPEYRTPAVTETVPEPTKPTQTTKTTAPAVSEMPKEAEPEPEAAGIEPKEPESQAPSEDGVSPAFKETMDSYEAYFDEYIAVMESVSNGSSDLNTLLRYAEFMEQYAEVTEKLENLDTSEMSEADHDYYTKVMLRIDKKLIEAAERMQ